jgi:hypothetical protein
MSSLWHRLAISLLLILVVSFLFYQFKHAKSTKKSLNAPSKGTYRARNIPERYSTRQECQRLIETLLSLPDSPCTIQIRSFATTIDHSLARTIIARTVTFDLEKVLPLQLAPNRRDEWAFKIPESKDEEDEEHVTIDTHFVGFTVLSSPGDEDYKFEYIR